jgi:hypothetical protein
MNQRRKGWGTLKIRRFEREMEKTGTRWEILPKGWLGGAG